MNGFQATMANLLLRFHLNFIADSRYKYILDGLGTTVIISFFAVLLGIALGLFVAVIKVTHVNTVKPKIDAGHPIYRSFSGNFIACF